MIAAKLGNLCCISRKHEQKICTCHTPNAGRNQQRQLHLLKKSQAERQLVIRATLEQMRKIEFLVHHQSKSSGPGDDGKLSFAETTSCMP